MSRICYDSTNPFDIPVSAQAVAGYCDGIYVWSSAGWNRFPNAAKVRIAISAFTNDGHVLDIENGDASPAQAPSWCKMRLASGLAAVTCYVNRSNRTAVETALINAGLKGAPIYIWVATLDGTQTAGQAEFPVIAVQYANSALAGGHYDLSIIDDFWPGVDYTHGGSTGIITGGNDMLYVGPVHPFAKSLQAFTPGNVYSDPAADARIVASLAKGGSVTVKGYIYSGSAIQSPDLGNGQPGPDNVWWITSDGHYVPDAILLTVGVTGAPGPNIPSVEPLAPYFAKESDIPTTAAIKSVVDTEVAAQVVTQAEVTSIVNAAIAAIPAPKVPSLWTVLKNTVWPSS